LRVRNALRRAGSQNNPVTGLPGEKLMADQLGLILEREQWAVISIKIIGLDKFNDIYGFVARDDVLRAIALTLTSAVDELGSIDDFVCHPVESQFIIATVPATAERMSAQIEERLNQAMTYFYPIHDREAGYVKRGDDEGTNEKVPFMNLSVAVLSHDDKEVKEVDHLLDALQRVINV
jgi:GGDEF domain-containing protein